MAQTPPAKPASSDQQTPAPVKTSITVTDTISEDAPAAITTLDASTIQTLPGIDLDDRLREVPGFTLFRRSSSLVANPTTQGVSLRGIGSSGASRTLVLWDGIPENDPFGGWVYWDRFAPLEMERVEISRGASTSVFGDLAMGGAIALFGRPAMTRRIEAAYEAGNEDSQEAYVSGSDFWNRFGISGYGRAFTTDGYYIVPQGIRGPVDTRASVEFVASELRLDYASANDRLFVRFDLLAEHRENGTRLQKNSTGLGSLAANYSHQWQNDQVSVLGYYTQEGFRASFSAIAANRKTETLSFLQRVPSDAVGAAALWRHSGANWHLLAGADTQRVEGWDTDRLFPSGRRVAGGTILQHGLFAQADYRVGDLTFFGGARHQFTGGGDTFFSPSGGLLYGRHWFRARGSVYRAFRAPTLNELYRLFRTGNVITEANPNLRPETMFGSEFGFDFVGETTRAGVTFYRNDLEKLITNVTLQTGATIIRQRQNATAALSRGIEANVQHNWGRWRGELGYLLADSHFYSGPRISQVPRNQGTGEFSYQGEKTTVAASVRAYSMQFDDDLNQFRLPGFSTVQLMAERRLTRQFAVRAAVENVLDRTYYVAYSPTPNTGSPRLWRVGLRWSLR